jgi:hypothetical protein
LKEALKAKGIDLRDRALTIESGRDIFFQQELMKRRNNAMVERMAQLATDDKLKEKYKRLVDREVEKLEQNNGQKYY